MKQLSSLMLLIVLLAAFTSCQPEVNPYNPSTNNSQNDTVGGLLRKIDGKSMNDSVNVTFHYDAQKRWLGSRIWSYIQGDTVKVILTATRDAGGYLTKCVIVDSTDYTDVFTDTYNITHDNNTGHYVRSIINHLPFYGITDTLDFLYDNSNKIIRRIQYDGFQYGSDTILLQYNTAANLDSIITKPRQLIGGARLGLLYDNKISPVVFANEGIVIQMPYLYGMGNMTMFTHTDAGHIVGQGIISYTYNINNKPSKALITMLPSNRQCFLNYHYQ